MSSMLPPLGWDSLLHYWHVRPLWLAFAVLALGGYVGALVVARRHGVRATHPARVASFVAGIAVLLFTVSSAIDTYAMAVFWDHMIEHLLLIMVVPALMVMGSPLSVARAAAATRGREGAVDAFARSWPVSLLTHPVVGLGLYSVVIVGTHLTGFMDAMAMHGWLMDAEQWLYVFSGYVFLLPLIGTEPIRWQVPYLGKLMLILVGMTPDTVVGIVLMQTNYDMFPMMEAGHPAWAPPPMQDLNIAGGLMWAGGDGLMMLFGIGVTLAMISHPGTASLLGKRLESVRRSTLVEHAALAGGTTVVAEEGDVDDDESMLDAYNEMLARLGGQPPERRG